MLEVKDLVKSYGTGKNQNKVLRGVNFTIHKGEFVAVMGPLEAEKRHFWTVFQDTNRSKAERFSLMGKTSEN